MCSVCGAHCATWVGEDEHGDREYTLDCLDEDGQRYIVNHSDLLGAVCELHFAWYNFCRDGTRPMT